MRPFARAILVMVAALAGGCAASSPPPAPVRLVEPLPAPSADVTDLADVLAAAVTDDGRCDGPALAEKAQALDRQVALLAVSGPTVRPDLYPSGADQWAYWLNARLAWSLKLAALAGCPRRTEPSALLDRPFPCDGRMMTLRDLDAILLAQARRSGQFRLAACAPGVLLAEAPLPRKPYRAQALTEQLDEALDVLVRDSRRLTIDVEARTVWVPRLLWDVREEVLESYGGPCDGTVSLLTALRPHVGRLARKRLDAALGYAVAPRAPTGELAVPGPRVYYPGAVGKVERP